MDHDLLEFVSKLSIIVIRAIVVFGGEELAEYLVHTIRLQALLGGLLPRTTTSLAKSVALVAFL